MTYARILDMSNLINSPKHYTSGGIEAIDFIRAKLGARGFTAYCIGNCFKYLSRYGLKGGVDDLEKCRKYLDWAIDNERNRLGS